MILAARQSRASDLHLEAQFDPPAGGQVAVLRIRIDGALHPLARFDVRLLSPVVERWKALAACDVHEHKRPQDGRIAMQLGPTKSLDLRVCFLPTLFGEAVTVRLLVPEQVNLDLSRIDYAAADRDRLLKALDAPHGMIIVTGPTGCGKTTVLYSCLTHLARPSCKVMSVEDPVEFVLPGVTQSQVMPNAGFGFPQALRAILRSDPDVVMVGEIRDAETMQLCCQTALTGHVVLSTLHAEDAASALRRIVDIGVPPFVVAGSLRLVLSQRLVRLVCPKCGRAKTPPQNVLATARELAGAGGLNFQELSPDFRSPVGCRDCGGVGYRGRTVIAETLEMSSAVASALQRGAPADELRRIAVAEGMATMVADGIRRAAAGQTTLDEVLSTLPIR
jgi:type II secretory ATPase GspE/PulE/Tfp pilus assembly ATPase PilB-like protein